MEPKTCQKGPKLGFEYWPTSKTLHCVHGIPLVSPPHHLAVWWTKSARISTLSSNTSDIAIYFSHWFYYMLSPFTDGLMLGRLRMDQCRAMH